MAFSFDDCYVYLISEYVNGPNLKDLLFDKRSGKFEFLKPEYVRIASQCAQAVFYFHALKPMIIHQDIKSANVLVHCSDPPVAKLCDFVLGKMKTMQTITSGANGI